MCRVVLVCVVLLCVLWQPRLAAGISRRRRSKQWNGIVCQSVFISFPHVPKTVKKKVNSGSSWFGKKKDTAPGLVRLRRRRPVHLRPRLLSPGER